MRVEMDGVCVSDGRGCVKMCGAGAAGEKRSGGRRRGGVHAAGPPPPHDLKINIACARKRTQRRERGERGQNGDGRCVRAYVDVQVDNLQLFGHSVDHRTSL